MKQEAKKTAIITGSGRGIGKETAIMLAKKPINVVFVLGLKVKLAHVKPEALKEKTK